ncbi:hypothetical protein L1987_30137 [Smallanthus sonchifolius]|uniref:Uncharacterized protein n=1 Tax=Smallanthus sonchifolius TaxID=185202 RepID=A0ACB9I3E8_9ASTR|nr:hypothetical protein L1987_30137 [Smallanthus sonchifolius]
MLIKNLSKGKKQKVLEKEDEGKRSGKKIETSKKGKGKEKVEEGLQIKVDSEKKNQKKVKVKKLLLICAPGNRITLLQYLTKSQKTVVKEIDFGKPLLLKLHTIPTSLGYWLLQNYDPTTNILNDGTNEYKLTTSLIDEIFGIPNGETQVTQMSKPKTYDPVVKEWGSQFDDEMQKNQKKISISDLVEYLKKTDDSRRMFKLNFMVVLMSIIGETMKSNIVNLRFLTSLKTNTNFKKLDWCEYVKVERIEKELKKVEEHAEKLKMLFEKERKDYPSKSNEENPKIEIANTKNVGKETIGEKEIVEEMVGEKPVGGTEKIGEEMVVEKTVGEEELIKETKEDEIKKDTMEAEGDKMGEGEEEVKEKKQEKPKRKLILSDALCSPYKQRKVVMEEKLTNVKKNISSYLFCGKGFAWDLLFQITDVITIPRIELETLSPGIELHVDVINAWAHVLNNEELKRNRDSSVFTLFCTAPMIVS